MNCTVHFDMVRVMADETEAVFFTARDLREITGMSSRQINDWDDRGALPSARVGEAGWRRFTPREVFALAVCMELRQRFGLPVERLKFVLRFMLQDAANHLQAAARLVEQLGVSIWLLTDSEKTFILDSELEFEDLFKLGAFGGPEDAAFAFLKVNPIVDRILARLPEPISLPLHGRGRELLGLAHSPADLMDPREVEVLETIRSGDYSMIEVTAKDGRVVSVTRKRILDADDVTRIAQLLKRHDYQRIIVTQQDGKVVFVEQQVTERL